MRDTCKADRTEEPNSRERRADWKWGVKISGFPDDSVNCLHQERFEISASWQKCNESEDAIERQ
jgi:hypothetical protein